jgi:hypothetical protein
VLGTANVGVSPLLRSWSLRASFPPDLAISAQTVGVPQASDSTLPVSVYNLGYLASDSAFVTALVQDPGGTYRVIGQATTGVIPPDSFANVSLPLAQGIPSPHLRHVVDVAPAGSGRDADHDNNRFEFVPGAVAVSEPMAADVRVYADGVNLMEGDYVSARPHLRVQLANVSGIPDNTARVAVFLDQELLSPPAEGSPAVRLSPSGTGPQVVEFEPDLREGLHEITVKVYRLTGGRIDSLQRRLTVQVSDEYRLLSVFNYPNPFRESTEFTFVLSGAGPPEEVVVRVFTVSGRRIQELRPAPGAVGIGFNRVFWDGRDTEGDEVANGYYFYQIQVSGGGKTVSAIQKLVRMR